MQRTDGVAIAERVRRLLAEIPRGVTLLAAAKMRDVSDVRAAIDAGIAAVGENYVQEAEALQASLGRQAVEWHLIGHLQRNKAKEAVRLFDLIQTVDSERLAAAVDAASRAVGRVTPILVEVNSAREPQKSGALPEDVTDLVRAVGSLSGLRVVGLMTMGPLVAEPEAERGSLRLAFRETRRLFDALRAAPLAHATMDILSMGMSDSYRVAIEEGATMVRVGTGLFGSR